MELMEERVNTKLDKIDGRIEVLMADKNRREGALALGKVASGIAGGLSVDGQRWN